VGSAASGFTRRESRVTNQKESTVKKMRGLYRIGALAGAIILPMGAVLASGIPEASAATTQEFCYYDAAGHPACLNAWSGGPLVNVEASDSAAIQNNHFQLRFESNGNVEIQFVGGGTHNNQCVGDASNDPSLANTGLTACGTISNGSGAGWGTQFTIAYGTGSNGCPDDTIMFGNNHWTSSTGHQAWLGPPNGYVNGSHFYLNKPGQICFRMPNV
jgi:hypothetical protein